MPVTYRKATHDDNFGTFTVFRTSIEDYSQRTGMMGITGGHDPEKMQQLWERRRPLWEHLTDTSDQFWLAENENHEIVGFEVPMINTIAIDYLISRGYRIEGFMGSIMSDKPFGKLENYLLSSPPFFL